MGQLREIVPTAQPWSPPLNSPTTENEKSTTVAGAAMPWRQKLAEKLEDAIEDAIAGRSSVIITKPFARKNFEEGGELNVKIIPPPTPPLKRPLLPPQIFNPREFEI